MDPTQDNASIQVYRCSVTHQTLELVRIVLQTVSPQSIYLQSTAVGPGGDTHALHTKLRCADPSAARILYGGYMSYLVVQLLHGTHALVLCELPPKRNHPDMGI